MRLVSCLPVALWDPYIASGCGGPRLASLFSGGTPSAAPSLQWECDQSCTLRAIAEGQEVTHGPAETAGSVAISALIAYLAATEMLEQAWEPWQLDFFKCQRVSGVQEQKSPDKSIISGFLVAQPMLGTLMRPDAALVHNLLPMISPHPELRHFPFSVNASLPKRR